MHGDNELPATELEPKPDIIGTAPHRIFEQFESNYRSVGNNVLDTSPPMTCPFDATPRLVTVGTTMGNGENRTPPGRRLVNPRYRLVNRVVHRDTPKDPVPPKPHFRRVIGGNQMKG
jgi:hypothetical protein